MSDKCKKCSKSFTTRSVKVQCNDCQVTYHAPCVNLTKEDVEYIQSEGGQLWRCEVCTKGRRKSMQVASTLEEGKPNLMDVINLLNEMRNESKDQISKLELDLGNSVENCHQVIEELKVTVQAQAESLNKFHKMYEAVIEENRKLQLRIKELERNADEAEQYSRMNCVEINGVPEKDNENVLEIVKNVGNSLGLTVSEEMVDACHRLGGKRVGETRPRGIIVKFTRRLVKEELLRKRRVKRNLNTHDLGFTNTLAEVVYINESLTKARREVYKEVRELKKKKDFSFVWVKNGKILVRPEDGARVIAATTMDDVRRLSELPATPVMQHNTDGSGFAHATSKSTPK